MTLTVKVGSVQILSTTITMPAAITVCFRGSRWFGWRISITAADAKGGTVAVARTG